MKSDKQLRKETAVIHKGYDSTKHHDSLAVPLYQTSTYSFETAEIGEQRFAGSCAGNIYSRLGNPTVRVLEEKMMEMEHGAQALAFGSGMAAVSAILIHNTKTGDHIVCSRGIYGCTFGLLEMMEEKYKISHSFHALDSEENVRQAIQENTTCIYIETPINPTMEIIDIEMVSRIAKEHGLKVIVDNTFSSPMLQNPLLLGADYVLHSATKYINGHGDVIAGLLVGKDEEDMQTLRMTVQKDVGGIISPFDAWLIIRGLKTLPIRMEKHSENAVSVLEYLKNHEMVEDVYYPHDMSHPQYNIAKKQMALGGGLISFTIKGSQQDAQKFMNALQLIKIAVSLGDAETLIQHPATMTHSVIPEPDREKMGITNTLLRMSIGLEHLQDVIDDLDEAFSKTFQQVKSN